jgi:hypothetical protein
MSAHLTNEELTDNLLGVSSMTVNAHLLGCPACAEELDGMKTSITAFHDAAHAWNEDALSSRSASIQPASLRHDLSKKIWASNWVLATAAVLLFAIGFVFYQRSHSGTNSGSVNMAQSPKINVPANGAESSASQIEQDNELMSQVNSEIAEAVPAPMQPLQLPQSITSNSSTAK